MFYNILVKGASYMTYIKKTDGYLSFILTPSVIIVRHLLILKRF